MKTTTLRTFLTVHTWTGLIAGMALFIAFYAGAITVFTHELGDWQRRPAAATQSSDGIARTQALQDAVLATHPPSSLGLFLILPGEHGPNPSAYLYDEASGHQRRFVLDAHGKLLETPPRTGFVDFLYDLHFTAGLPRTIGTYLFGVVCVLYGLALVSGVILYAPVMLKDLFALRIGRNLKRLWQDAHNAIGILSLPFHALFAWSGAVLTIGLLLLVPFQTFVYDGKLFTTIADDFEVAPHAVPSGTPGTPLTVAELIGKARESLPTMVPNSIDYSAIGDSRTRAIVYGDTPGKTLSTASAVAMEATSGRILRVVQPHDYSAGRAFLYALYSLHFGNFGGYAVKWLYFLLGLAGAFLFYSGNLLWIESRRHRRQPHQPRRTRLMAALTLGVCLGAVAGISATFLAGALLPDIWAPRLYFLVFFGSIGWALVRPPARAGHELLLLCAVLTALIPVAGWLGTGEHLLRAAINGHWHRFFVDAVALLLALVYWRLARATLRRGRTGEPNSVWALPAPHA